MKQKIPDVYKTTGALSSLCERAARAGLSRATVTAVRGGKSCSAETARKLVSVLGTRIADREEDKTE